MNQASSRFHQRENERDNPTHFSRQLENGRWTSKLCDAFDVEHETLEAVEVYFGKAYFFLKKKV
jgi:hypothetical protein